jgi:hypothetical protein
MNVKKMIIGAVIIGAGVAGIIYLRKHKRKKFDENCKANGGTILESGKFCSIK